MRWRSVILLCATALLVSLKLRLERRKLGERRIRVGLSAAPLLRIDPLARLVATIAILEIAPAAFAARATIRTVALPLRTIAATALALLRTAIVAPLGLI